MPIPLRQLDDRRYDDLVDEMRALIPQFAPDWTDHNASDPGIMLIELFAWLAEAIIYRLNRIPEASEQGFLELLDRDAFRDYRAKLDGQQGPGDRRAALVDAFYQAERKIHTPWRAVTAEDFEVIAKKFNGFLVARAKCLPETDRTACPEGRSRPGHVSLVVVEKSSVKNPEMLLKELKRELDKRCLINTCLHVLSPRYVHIYVEAEVVLSARAKLETVRNNIIERLTRLFDPGKNDPRSVQAESMPERDEFEPWQFGRPVADSEVYHVIEETEGVDFVSSLQLFGRPFCFCVALSDAKPSAKDPDEVVKLNKGKLPDKLKRAFAERGIDHLPSDPPVKWDAKKNRWSVDLSSDNGSGSNPGSGKNDYEVERNGGLLDVYGPFEQARQRDGNDSIRLIDLPMDGLVYFDQELTSIAPRNPR